MAHYQLIDDVKLDGPDIDDGGVGVGTIPSRRPGHVVTDEEERYTWDLVMAFRRGEDDKTVKASGGEMPMTEFCAKETARIVQALRDANLKTTLYRSAKGDLVFCLIGATERRLEQEADRTDYDLLLDTNACLEEGLKLGVRLARQTRSNEAVAATVTEEKWRNLFGKYDQYNEEYPWRQRLYVRHNTGDPHHADSFFRTVDRLKLLKSIIESETVVGGAGLRLGKSLEAGVHPLTAVYPLHEENERLALHKAWHPWRSLLNQPLSKIRDYMGEQISLYFAFLQYYNKWLILPGFLGLLVAIWQFVTSEVEVPATPFFGLLMALWATLYLEFWKRKESQYRLRWGMTNFSIKEQPRADFEGEWVVSEVDGSLQETFSWKKKALRAVFSQSVVWTLIGVVFASVFSIIIFRKWIDGIYPTYGGYAAAVLNGIQISILNFVYGLVSRKLNDYENHRTDTQYENALIAKSFLFKFVNSYNSLFIIAYFKDPNSTGKGGCNGSCLGQLQQQLGTIFITQIVINNAVEILGPVIKNWLNRRKADKVKPAGGLSPAEEQFDMQEYESTFDDFDELVVQYGYVTLFVVAFPLTPLLALVNNIFETRLDSAKLLRLTRRPKPQGAADIGTWYTIINILGFIAVITNVSLVVFETRVGRDLVGDNKAKKFFVFVLAEHILFLIKFAISYFVPDEPVDVAMHRARQEYVVDVLINGFDEEDDVVDSGDALRERGESVSAKIETDKLPTAVVESDHMLLGVE